MGGKMDRQTAMKMQKAMQEEVKHLQEGEKKISSLAGPKAKYASQLSENEIVLQELERVEDGAQIYKRVGPVLILQDNDEALANVKHRISHFKTELERLERTEKEEIKKVQEHKEKAMKIQALFQKAQQEAVKRAAAQGTSGS